jgi:UDPglucose--hexose-1-phosphate uridylyltransferase
MSEFRQNLVTRSWVIIAPERGKRPNPIHEEIKADINLPEYSAECPFCPGNDSDFNIIETDRIDDENGNWKVRVIDNRYKVLQEYPTCPIQPERFEDDGIYMRYHGCGSHELVIETPKHNKAFSDLSVEEMNDVVEAYYRRFEDYRHNFNNLYTLIFKNYGAKAGASQPHGHTQILGSRIVPLAIRYQLFEMERFFDTRGVCVMCYMLDNEHRYNDRLIYENEHFTALVPYAASVPYEIWLSPKVHDSSFLNTDETKRASFSEALNNVMKGLAKILDTPQFNMVMFNATYPLSNVPYFHWYCRIVPRTSVPGGFEVGTGISVNPIAPEESAAVLRESIV